MLLQPGHDRGGIALAQRAFAEGDAAAGQRLLDEFQWEPRGWEHRFWSRFDTKQSLKGEAFSPDGQRIADRDSPRP